MSTFLSILLVGFILATIYFIGMYYKTKYHDFLFVIIFYVLIDIGLIIKLLCLL